MVLSPQLVGGVQIGAGVVALTLLKPGVDNADTPGSFGYSIFTAGAALWMFGLGVPKFTVDYTLVVSGLRVQMLGTELAAVGWLLLALVVTDYRDLVRRTAVVAGGAIVFFQFLLWTNPLHQIMYEPGAGVIEGMIVRDGETAIEATFGWWWIHTAGSYLWALAGEAILLAGVIRSDGIRRKQFVWLSLMAVPILPASIVSTFDLFNLPFNVSSVGFLLAVPILAVVLFRTRFLDIVPVARQTAIEEIDAAMITLDGQDRVVDANERARELFDYGSAYIGTPAAEFFSAGPAEVFTQLSEPTDARSEVTLTSGGQQRHFAVSSSPVGDQSGQGWVVLLHDVTERKEYEQQVEEQRNNLEMLNQVVRHDIRNELQVVSAYAEMLESTVTGDGQEYVDRVIAATRDAIDITTTAREVTEAMLQSDLDPHAVQLHSVLEAEIADVRSNHDDAVIHVDGSLPVVDVRADELLGSVFRNLLTNAIQHNDSDVPEVTLSATTDEDWVVVRIADDGPGIPDERKRAVFEQGEMGLESDGTGLGLYLVETLVGRYGGEVRIRDNEPEGSIFIVELPLAETG